MPLSILTETRIAVGETVEIENGLTGVYMDDDYGAGAGRLINAGLLAIKAETGISSHTSGSLATDGRLFWNQASGALRVYNDGRLFSTTGVLLNISYDVINDGLIEVWGPTLTFGVAAYSRSDFNNTGVLKVYGEDAIGLFVLNGGVTVNNSGLVYAHGDLSAVGMHLERQITQGGFTNSGMIVAETSADSPYASIGVHFFNGLSGVSTFTNTGLIKGDYAFRVAETQELGFSTLFLSSEVIYNSGVLDGVVFTAYGDDVVHNSGVITGLVDLYQGNDQYDGVGDSHGAVVSGGNGDDTLVGGSGDDVLLGGEGSDTLWGGDGDDYIEGGRGADRLNGQGGIDTLSYINATRAVSLSLTTGWALSDAYDTIESFEVVVGSRFNDTIVGSVGADTLQGLAGHDSLVGGDGDDWLFGDTGADTLTGGAGDDNFVFSRGDGADVITDFQAGGTEDRLTIRGYSAYQSLTQVGADTVVRLSISDSITLRNVTASALTSADFVFEAQATPAPLSPSLSPILLQEDFSVAAGEELRFTNPEATQALNQVRYAGLILDVRTTTMQLVNAGAITLDAGWVSGRVSAIDSLIVGTGPQLFRIDNQASGVIRAHATNASEVITLRGGGEIWNAGRIEALSDGGNAVGVHNEAAYNYGVNLGVVHVEAGLSGIGLNLRNFSGFHNSGTIEVDGGATSYGLKLESNFGYVVNSGAITVADSTGLADSVGLYYAFGMPSAIYNAGIIEADYAVRQNPLGFSSAPSNLVTIYNSGELRGRVDLGAGRGQLYNTGAITGRVDLGDGNDIYDGRGGSALGGVHGGFGADILLGGAAADTLDGGQANDIVAGGGGDDLLTGGTGDDSFYFEAGGGHDTITDFVAGGTEDRVLVVGYASYVSAVQQGGDTLVTFSGSDSILLRNVQAAALTSADFQFSATALPTSFRPLTPPLPNPPPGPTVTPLPPVYQLDGQMIAGDGEANTLTGGAGGDVISGGGGNDVIRGGGGADVLRGDAGADLFVYAAGDGKDFIDDFKPSEGDVLFLQGYTAGQVQVREGDSLQVQVVLSDGAYITLRGARLTDFLTVPGAIQWGPAAPATAPIALPVLPDAPPMPTTTGTGGADGLTGGDQGDYLDGAAGADTLDGGLGDDTLDGGDGDDFIIAGPGNDAYYGGFGMDTISFANAAHGITLDMTEGEWRDTGDGMDVVGGIEVFIGSAHDDHVDGWKRGPTGLYGGDGNDTLIAGLFTPSPATLDGGVGDDSLLGGDGADLLYGGDGADTLDGRGGRDTLYGGSGADLFVVRAGSPAVVIGDFNPVEDRIKLFNWQGHSGLEASGADTVVHLLAGPDIILRNVAPGQLSSANFIPVDEIAQYDYMPNLQLGSKVGDTLTGLLVHSNSLIGLSGNDVLVGGNMEDYLDGSNGADTLTGGQGNDLLYGGTGRDTAVFNVSSTSASIARSDVRTFTVISGDGDDVVSGVERLQFTDRVISLDSLRGDLTGDGSSDILLRHQATGQIYHWDVAGRQQIDGGSYGVIGADWTVQATADINGDGTADIVLKNTSTGQFYAWTLAQGGAQTGNVNLGFIGAEWDIDVSADLNGDGVDELVWKNTSTGQFYVWGFDRDGHHTRDLSLGVIGTDWTVQAAGDLNGDGFDDLVWKNSSTGQFYVWTFGEDGRQAGGSNLGVIGTDWTVQGAGDFNGDGVEDLVWKNTATGQFYLWTFADARQSGGQNLGVIGAAWDVVGTGDYGGSATADLLWRNGQTGQIYLWTLDSLVTTGEASFGTIATDWHVV